MNSNKSKEECITWLSLHGLVTSATLQELRMQINKFQLYPSLTKTLKVKNEQKFIFVTSMNSLEIPPISSPWSCDCGILPKVTRQFSGNILPKKWRVLLANSRKHTRCWQVGRLSPSNPFLSLVKFHLWKHKSKNPLVIKFVLPPSYFKIQSLLRRTVSSQ